MRVQGLGSCLLNAAARHLLSEIAMARGLGNRFPAGLIAAKDTVTGNPVLLPTDDKNLETAPINWGSDGRSPSFNLSGPLAAWNIPVHLGRRETLHVPVTLVHDPATKQPGLMLQWDAVTKHDVVQQGPRKLARAQRELARMQAAVTRLETLPGRGNPGP